MLFSDNLLPVWAHQIYEIELILSSFIKAIILDLSGEDDENQIRNVFHLPMPSKTEINNEDVFNLKIACSFY